MACSLARKSCILHTPNKARLIERLPEGNRRAALDVLSGIRPKAGSVLDRASAWKQLSIASAHRFATPLNQSLAVGIQTALPQNGQGQSMVG